MHISPRTGHTIEKVIRDADGRLVRATFYIYQSGTRIRARLVNSEFIDHVKEIASKVLALSGFSNFRKSDLREQPVLAFAPAYFSTNQLYFSGSKPRAPTDTN